MTPSLAHSTPFRSRRSLAKVSTNSRSLTGVIVSLEDGITGVGDEHDRSLQDENELVFVSVPMALTRSGAPGSNSNRLTRNWVMPAACPSRRRVLLWHGSSKNLGKRDPVRAGLRNIDLHAATPHSPTSASTAGLVVASGSTAGSEAALELLLSENACEQGAGQLCPINHRRALAIPTREQLTDKSIARLVGGYELDDEHNIRSIDNSRFRLANVLQRHCHEPAYGPRSGCLNSCSRYRDICQGCHEDPIARADSNRLGGAKALFAAIARQLDAN